MSRIGPRVPALKFQELLDLTLWEKTSETRRDEIVRLILSGLGSDFDYVHRRSYDRALPLLIDTFLHKQTGIPFNLIPVAST